jgi:hypothetical protein
MPLAEERIMKRANRFRTTADCHSFRERAHLIILAIWERGEAQQRALKEIDRRGLWLSEEQKIQAGLACAWPRGEM